MNPTCELNGQPVPCPDPSFFIGFGVVWLAVIVLMFASLWRIFTKAGQAGWKVLIPIYNIVVALRIVGRPAWWVVLMFIPFVNAIVAIVLCLDLAKSFGRGTGFGIGLAFLNVVFVPILAFGDSRYVGPAHGQAAASTPAPATPAAPLPPLPPVPPSAA